MYVLLYVSTDAGKRKKTRATQTMKTNQMAELKQ